MQLRSYSHSFSFVCNLLFCSCNLQIFICGILKFQYDKLLLLVLIFDLAEYSWTLSVWRFVSFSCRKVILFLWYFFLSSLLSITIVQSNNSPGHSPFSGYMFYFWKVFSVYSQSLCWIYFSVSHFLKVYHILSFHKLFAVFWLLSQAYCFIYEWMS